VGIAVRLPSGEVYALSDIRAKFTRGSKVKYISHLDIVRTFERTIRRARIPIAYSQGFNPHPQMVFGLPLPVGVTSEAEYADFEMAYPVNPWKFRELLNKELPDGLKIIDAREKATKINIMASIIMSSYHIWIVADPEQGENDVKETIDAFLRSPSIIVKKEGKQGVREVDIKPMIHKLELENFEENNNIINSEGHFCISALLSAGSMANLKPELLIKAMDDKTGLGVRHYGIHRTGLFVCKGGKILDPLDEAVLSA